MIQEWNKGDTDLPSPLKNDAPTWARSPKIPADNNEIHQESDMANENWTKSVSLRQFLKIFITQGHRHKVRGHVLTMFLGPFPLEN